MPRGISAHFGLNAVDPAHYSGWQGKLQGCENDATAMASLAQAAGIANKIYLTQDATSDQLFADVRSAASSLTNGDLFLLTFSGHGGQIKDTTLDEADGLDETMCFFDRAVIDDEIYLAFNRFAAGVRILVIADSCHSGSVVKVDPPNHTNVDGGDENWLERLMPPDVADATFLLNEKLYSTIQNLTSSFSRDSIPASVLLLSACQDNQLSSDGVPNGRYTSTFLKVWSSGNWNAGGYDDFVADVLSRMPRVQSPGIYRVGTPNISFSKQRPFTV